MHTMKNLKISKKQIIIIIILVLGIVFSVTLVQKPQIFKSRAQEVYNAFEINDSEGNSLNCTQNTCQSDSLDIQIKVRDLNSLISN